MKKIKLGIVGLNFGKQIVEQLLKEQSRLFEISVLCDLDIKKTGEIAKKNGLECRTVSDYDEMLADKELVAVGIFTGPGGRAGMVRKAVNAGKHVMTTKPFETDPKAALEVLRYARKKGIAVHLNSPSSIPSNDITLIEGWIKKYQLGKPVAARMDVWASYREKADGSWYDDPDKCPVSPVFRMGIYLINDLVRLFGEGDEATVLYSRLFTGRPTPDNAQLGILFKNGMLANIFASFCVNDGDFYRNSLTLNFENGTIYRNCGPRRNNLRHGGAEMQLVMVSGEKRKIVADLVTSSTSGGYDWDSFYKAVTGRKLEGEIEPEAIVAGLKIIEAMRKAAKSGRIEKI